MDFNAFDLIRDGMKEELLLQGFAEPQPMENDEGRAEIFATDEVAYSLLYDDKRQRFELRSTTLNGEGEPGDWRSLSLWLFDETDGTKSDAESILNDFLEVVRGPKRVAIVQQKKKRGKDDERNIDPLFFLNRLMNIFPELREEMKNERITYGQIRFVTFTKEKVVPKCEDLATRYRNSEPFEKLCTLFSDMYEDGDMDLRSIISITILNGLSEDAFTAMNEKFSEGLQTDVKYTRKLIGKTIKPEKKKKQKKVSSRLKA